MNMIQRYKCTDFGLSSRQKQPTGGAVRWLSPSFFITMNNEILCHECYCIVLIQISNCQMLKCWQMVD